MQKDDWREERRDRPEGLVLQYGTCRFCGQVRQIETAAGWDQEQVDEAASTSCSCPGAEDDRHGKKIKVKGHEAVDRQFHAIPEGVREIIHSAVDLIVTGEIKKLSIDTGRKTKVSISATAKGGIKVERIENQKETEEI